MKIVHMADSHLGFSSYSRLDQHGRNRIEEMVYSGFEQAVEKIIQLRPDAVVHAGDVFHHVRPKIKPLVVFQRGLFRLSAGGHTRDNNKRQSRCPQELLIYQPLSPLRGYCGMCISPSRYRYERFSVGDYNFHCIPFCLEPQDYLKEFEKIERSGRDVLVMHGLVESLEEQEDEERGRA